MSAMLFLIVSSLIVNIVAIRRENEAYQLNRSLRLSQYTPETSCSTSIQPPRLDNATWTLGMNTRGVSVVQYLCKYGYVASQSDPDSDSMRKVIGRCQDNADGSQSVAVNATCTVGYCDISSLQSAVVHGTIASTSSDNRVDSVVTITCNNGYSIDGSANGPTSRQLTCSEDLSLAVAYSPMSANDCQPITCGEVTLPSNAVIASSQHVGQKVQYQDVVQYTCMSGYFFKPFVGAPLPIGSVFSKQCSSTGAMVSSVEGECVSVQCPLPLPSFSGADLVGHATDPIFLSSQAQYLCAMGQTFHNATTEGISDNTMQYPTSFRITCIVDSDGRAVYDTDPAIARCLSKPCQSPPPVPSNDSLAIMVSSPTAQYYIGQTVEYQCVGSSVFPADSTDGADNTNSTSFSGFCNDDGEWTLSLSLDTACVAPKCSSIDKASPMLIAHTVLDAPDYALDVQIGQSVDLTCDKGYFSTAPNASNVTTNGSGTFSVDISNNYITVSCNTRGYFESTGQCTRMCGPLPPVPGNATVTLTNGAPYVASNYLSTSVSAAFTCDSGLSIDGSVLTKTVDGLAVTNNGQTLQCMESAGNVTSADFSPPAANLANQCLPISCGLPGARPHAHWSNDSPIKSYNSGESVTYQCDYGFGLIDLTNDVVGKSYDVQCTDFGWDTSNTSNVCEQITCPSNPIIARGSLVGTLLQQVNVGDTLSMVCNYGTAASNLSSNSTITLTCTESGNYDPPNYGSNLCANIVCPRLPDNLVGATKADPNLTTLSLGDSPALYYCNPAWKLPPIKVFCREDRSYDVIGDECQIPTCTDIPPQLHNIARFAGPTTLGSNADMSCTDGYTTVDGAIQFQVTCTTPSGWTPINSLYNAGCSEIATSSTSTQVTIR